ncbi:unnamed protein product, partial [Prorocentrum cordatum]
MQQCTACDKRFPWWEAESHLASRRHARAARAVTWDPFAEHGWPHSAHMVVEDKGGVETVKCSLCYKEVTDAHIWSDPHCARLDVVHPGWRQHCAQPGAAGPTAAALPAAAPALALPAPAPG